MDDTAAQLLHKIRSWLEEKENCKKNLWQLVKELENLRKNCNVGECVGNTISLLGSACFLGGAATMFSTAGAALPFLGVLGMASIGAGATIGVSSKLIELFVSGSTMKDAKKAAEKTEIIEEEIMKLIGKLRRERVNTEQAESEYIAMRISKAMWGKVHTGQPPEVFIKDGCMLFLLIVTFIDLSMMRKVQGSITKCLIGTMVLNLAKVGGKAAAKRMAVRDFEYFCMHMLHMSTFNTLLKVEKSQTTYVF